MFFVEKGPDIVFLHEAQITSSFLLLERNKKYIVLPEEELGEIIRIGYFPTKRRRNFLELRSSFEKG